MRSPGPGPALSIGGDVDIEGLTITGVQDPANAAVYIGSGADADLTRCIIYDNAGAAIYTKFDVSARHCTITDNGAGIISSGPTWMWVEDTIDYGNQIPSNYAGAAVCVSYSITQPIPSGLTCGLPAYFAKPELWDPRDGDFFLQPGSPAIDAGNPSGPLDPDGSPPDIGAVPYDPNHAPVEPTTYCWSSVTSQGCTPKVTATGVPSAGGAPFSVDCANLGNHKTGLLFYGYTAKASAYQGGWLCVVAPVRRTQVQDSGGTPAPAIDCSGTYSFDFGGLIGSGADPALVAGQAVFAQYWYRDPQLPGNLSTGRTEGLGFQIAP